MNTMGKYVGTYGRMQSTGTAIIISIISLILILIGYNMYFNFEYTKSTMGMVVSMYDCAIVSSSSPDPTKPPQIVEMCNYKITYKVNNNDFFITTNRRKNSVNVGETVKVYYNPADPSDAQIDGQAEKWFGAGMLCAGIGGIVYAIYSTYSAYTSEEHARIVGAGSIASSALDLAGLTPSRRSDGSTYYMI